jgi:citrate lyase subunit beta/citryl-CoA lyase
VSTTPPPRSLLAVPAANPKLLQSALRSQADAVMPDLEDAVAPEAKDDARAKVVRFLRDRATVDARLMVRVNDPVGELGRLDLAALAPYAHRLAAVVIPKSTAESVAVVQGLLEGPVAALIETAAGVEESYDIARQSHVAGVLFGSVDYTAELVSSGGWHFRELAWTKSRIVNAAAAGGVWALAGPCTALDDEPGLLAEIETDRALGFAGKLCIHPAQVARVNEAFAPSREQQEWAHRVLGVLGSTVDPGAIRIDGEMIDRPLIAQARRIADAGAAVTA